MSNDNVCRLAYWEEVMVRRPVVESGVAPVRDWYRWNASAGFRGQGTISVGKSPTHYSPVAMRMKVVPVSTIPAVDDRMVVPPYEIDWLIPQNSEAGYVVVSGT